MSSVAFVCCLLEGHKWTSASEGSNWIQLRVLFGFKVCMLQLRKAAKIPQLLTRMSFLVDARLPSACVCWRICRFKASHYEDNQPPWAELQSTQARRPLHLFPSLGVCTAEPDTCSQADWMPLFQCCPSMQLQEAGTPGRCVGMGAPAQKGQEVTAATRGIARSETNWYNTPSHKNNSECLYF